MTLWILSSFSASFMTYTIFTNCFLQRYYINTLYRQFKPIRYSSVVKVNIICFCRIGHTTSPFFAFFFIREAKMVGMLCARKGVCTENGTSAALCDAFFLVLIVIYSTRKYH